MSYPQRIVKFTDLNSWQEAHSLTLLIYKTTATFPKEEIYGLTSQIRRAAVSVESCIAEGFSRYHYKDKTTFYYDARGSLAEVESQITTAKDLGYLSHDVFTNIILQIGKVGGLLGGLIKKTQTLSNTK